MWWMKEKRGQRSALRWSDLGEGEDMSEESQAKEALSLLPRAKENFRSR